MTKQEAIKQKTELQAKIAKLQVIIDKPEINNNEQLFVQLTNNLVRKVDYEKYPDSIFYFIENGEFMIEQDFKNNVSWLSSLIWVFFSDKNTWNYQQTQVFLKDMLEKHFKCKELTPCSWLLYESFRLEKHFKCVGATIL